MTDRPGGACTLLVSPFVSVTIKLGTCLSAIGVASDPMVRHINNQAFPVAVARLSAPPVRT
jgi:hypothetical protein